MTDQTAVYLFGSLRGYEAGRADSPYPKALLAPVPLKEVLKQLEIPLERVQLAMVNHRAVDWDHVVGPGDRVALFPKEYAIFADWKSFRN